MSRRVALLGWVVVGVLATGTTRGQEAVPDRVKGAGVEASRVAPTLGLGMATPYARGKVPVVFIHGLWMDPSCWRTMLDRLRADPALDERFQFWTFGYATGDPIPLTTARLRQALNEARRRCDPDRTDAAFDRMVLVGHSMGGLLAKMMVIESGDRLWRVISERPLGELRGEPADRDLVSQATAFAPQPEVRRVVFIATPHQGSKVDAGSIHLLANRITHQTDDALASHRRLVDRNGPGFFRPYFERGLPSSVEELRVNGPFLAALHGMPVAPGVRAHSIIATRPEKNTDGLVTVESARLAGVESEKMVECPHALCPEDAAVIAEVRRILQAHQAQP